LRRLHPEPGTVDSAELFADLRLRERAPSDRPYLIVMEVFRRLRTQVDGLLVGTNTLAVERYGRAVKREELRAARTAIGLEPEPLFATVSRSGVLPLDAPLFAEPDARIVAFVPADTPEPACAAQLTLVRLDPAELTLTTALRRLRAEHDVRALLCEGGPTLMSALLGEELVAELFLTLAPQLAGGGTAPTLATGAALPRPAELTLTWLLERNGSLYLRYAIGHADGEAAV
jgi:riboflavin biosynthesis pyrimidine reductase